MKSKQPLLFVGIGIAVMVLVVLNIVLGSFSISLSAVIATLTSDGDTAVSDIIYHIRLPEVMMAMVVGSALAISGLLMQTFFRNPLAGPSVLGLSSGAGLGVAIAMMTGVFSGVTLGVSAIVLQILSSALGAGVVLLIVIALARIVKDNTSLLLIGLMVGYFTSAVVGSLQIFAERMSLQKFVFWGMGSFSSITGPQLLWVSIGVLVLIIITFLIIKPLDIYFLGEAYAESMGMNVKQWRILIILIAGLLTGVSTAFAGPIAFLGLAVPHMARMIFKSARHAVLVPSTVLLGVLSALVCLLISKLPGLPYRLPINSVTSLIGAPIVIYLIFQQRKIRL